MRITLIAAGIDFYMMVINEAGKALNHIDLHPLIGVQSHFAAFLQHAAAGFFHGFPVQRRFGRPLDAEVNIMGAVANAIRRGAPGLGGNTTTPQTFPTGERRIIDHGDLEAVFHQIARAILAPGTATDDHDIVVPVAFRHLEIKAGGFRRSRCAARRRAAIQP